MKGLRGLFRSWVVLQTLVVLWSMPSEARDARDWRLPYIERLREVHANYEDAGKICEEVARLELISQFKPRLYDIRMNISYGDRSHTVGELDVVIFDRRTGRAVVVAEVKCWGDPRKAEHEGRKQQRRFQEVLKNKTEVEFWDHEREKYSTAQFGSEKCEYMLIGQAGTRNYGFDMELRLNLEDLKDLRRAMLDCQRSGDCLPWKKH